MLLLRFLVWLGWSLLMIGLGISAILLVTTGAIYLFRELIHLLSSPTIWVAINVIIFTLIFYFFVRAIVLGVVKMFQKFFDAVS